MIWTIWREIYRRTFEGEEQSTQDIENIFLRTLYEYCTMIGGVSSCFSIVEFLDHMEVHSL